MKTKPSVPEWALLLLLALLTLSYQPSTCFAQGTAFTYQGRLSQNGSPAKGIYDLRFAIYDASGGANLAGGPLTNLAVAVNDGMFAVSLDFGNGVFTGAARWLEIGVRTNGGGVFSGLSPRQLIASTPYATQAARAMTVEMGTISNPGFLGTTTSTPLELSVNNRRALRLEDNGDSSEDPDSTPDGAPNVIGGSAANFVGSGVVGATIAGGGATNCYGFPRINAVLAEFGTIGGGRDHLIESGAHNSTIAGGDYHIIGTDSFISTIGGGGGNFIEANTWGATIAGGAAHDIGTNSRYSSVGGGYNNDIAANGEYATIPGGRENAAGGSYAFAAGRNAKASHQGAFVWADSTDADFSSTSSNQFLIRASGGVGIGTTNPATTLDVAGEVTAQAVTAQAYKLPSARTFVQQLTANSFVPDSPGEGYDRGAGLISPAGDTSLQFHAPVQLPHGATVTKLVGVFADLSTTEDFTDITLRLQYFTTNNFSAVTMAEIAGTNTVGFSAGRVEVSDTSIVNGVIDNYSRAYLLFLQFTVNSATANTRFYGVRIE